MRPSVIIWDQWVTEWYLDFIYIDSVKRGRVERVRLKMWMCVDPETDGHPDVCMFVGTRHSGPGHTCPLRITPGTPYFYSTSYYLSHLCILSLRYGRILVLYWYSSFIFGKLKSKSNNFFLASNIVKRRGMIKWTQQNELIIYCSHTLRDEIWFVHN